MATAFFLVGVGVECVDGVQFLGGLRGARLDGWWVDVSDRR